MYKICVDVMGADHGSGVFVSAIKQFLKDYQDVSLCVIGKKEELSSLEGLVEIVDAREAMGMEDGALEVLRKKETSMMSAIKKAKEEDYDAIVSAGSTGAFLTAATITFKLIEGVSRAALLSPFPTKNRDRVIILDIGASNENSAIHLLDFAKMGKIFTRIYKNKEPNLYLLSNGTEENKGSPLVKEAHKLIKEEIKDFKGNIEAREVLSGKADVVVCDGYSGNIFLKGAEGVAKSFSYMLKEAFSKNIFTKIGYLFSRKGINEIKDTMNYKKYGGAILLGVNKVVVKAHGSSDDEAIYSALKLSYDLSKEKVVEKMKEEINK